MPLQLDDASEQVQILLQSMTILVKLAMMDSATYHQSLQKNHDNNTTTSHKSTVCQLQKSLDNLQHQWRLEETPAMQLCTLIHGFHGTIYNLQKDAEEQATLYEQLYQKTQDYQERNAKLERALLKLHAQNAKLAAKVKQRATEKKSLVKHVQGYAQQVKDFQREQQQLEERTVAYQLQAHEQFLQQTPPSRRRCVSNDIPLSIANRARGLSTDSNFSDLDALDFGTSSGSNHHDHHQQQQVLLSGVGISSSSDDQSSVASLVTDGGVATVRLTVDQQMSCSSFCSSSPPCTPKREATLKDSNGGMSSFLRSPPWQSRARATPPPVWEITFPDATSIGLQFERLEVETLSNHSNVDWLTKSPQRRPKGILNHVIVEDGGPPALPSLRHDDAHMDDEDNKNFWTKVFGGKTTTDTDQPMDHHHQKTVGPSHSIFVVSGFQGFHDETDRPDLGATLVSINGNPVNGTWSLEDLHKELLARAQRQQDDKPEPKSGNEEPAKRVTLCFRHDPLSKSARERLEKANAERNEGGNNPSSSNHHNADVEKVTEGGRRSSARFGFLKMQSPGRTLKENLHQNQTAATDRCPSPEKVPRITTPKGGSKVSSMISSKLPTFFQVKEEQGDGANTTTPKSRTKVNPPFFPGTATTQRDENETKDEDSTGLSQRDDTGADPDHKPPTPSANILSFLSSQKLKRDNSVSTNTNPAVTASAAEQDDADKSVEISFTATKDTNEGNDPLGETTCTKDSKEALFASSESEGDETVESTAVGSEDSSERATGGGDKFSEHVHKSIYALVG
ncbi:expressed unknown protein [Seminavis robusta]|uniref:Uncharacterized protein n=1 Tax=Seminavis robusta TaxID=568900 RepID=A0A9N8DLD9_9STRA|nr:expressed unknown protein [Seminavis robusta]|eukprot:Sro143_g066590.1 n/a (793) ;mRNA; r:46228-48606